MRKRELKNVEWGILIIAVILTIIGLIALFSATQNTEYDEFKKQIVWFIVSLIIMLIFMLVDYDTLVRISPFFYGGFIILLIAVLFTKPINGATSWFSLGPISIQPAEFAKIAVVLFLANVMSKMSRTEINKPLKLLMLIGIIIVPVVLIVLQPDYGTAMAYIFATAIMLYVAGINKRYIILTLLILIISLPLLYFFVLPEHAKLRIDVYLNPYLDPRGAGYNIIQSKLAIGAGRLVGQGWMNGTQTHLGFLYPKTTDFIFAVIGEEMGFITCAGIIIMYIVLITRSITVAKNARDDLGSYIAAGIVRNTAFPRFRKYRNDNGTITYHRCAPSIYKLWRKLNAYKYDSNRTIAKYKLSTSKINV